LAKKTVIIVQARYASKRLPGKVLLAIEGKTVLWHVIQRLKGVSLAEIVCCAIPHSRDSDAVADEASRAGAVVFRGSEDDVLDRYWKAAKAIKADTVMRVTSDCPLIDPEICDDVLRLFNKDRLDYACNNMPPSWPHGLDCEVFSFAWLERAAREARLPSDREHVSPYIRNHPDIRRGNLVGPNGACVNYRWTLDYLDDLLLLRRIFAALPPGAEGWSYRKVLVLMESHPEWKEINAGYDRWEGLRKSYERDHAAGFRRADELVGREKPRGAVVTIVRLKPLALADSPLLLRWRNQPEIAEHSYSSHRISQDEHDAWFSSAITDTARKYWIIVYNEVAVGLANLYAISLNHQRCYWAFYIGESEVRGAGIGSVVEFLVLDEVLYKMGLHKLCCEVLATNEKVIRQHQKFGFEIEGKFREHIRRNDQYIDVVCMAIRRAAWSKNRKKILHLLERRGHGYLSDAIHAAGS
jgi:spore coat polysaccharide biosynthesis protein SpsF